MPINTLATQHQARVSKPSSHKTASANNAQPTSAAAVVSSATSESVISSSGLTTGESDDQPSAMQRAKAAEMAPPAPGVVTNNAVSALKQSTENDIRSAEKTRVAHTHPHSVAHKEVSHRQMAHKKVEQIGDWKVQVGVFSNSQNARRLVANLREHHLNAYALSVDHDNRRLVVVCVGPENNLQRAKMTQAEIQRVVHINGEIRKQA